MERKFNAAADAGVQHPVHGLYALGNIDRLWVDTLPPREGEELAGQGRAAPRCGLDGCDRTLQLGIVADALFQAVEAAAK